MQKKSKFIIGLTGNPNVGKSTLFNSLTGARQHVGNWPGKTVEKKEGVFGYKKKEIKVVDLPGSYSLTAYTEEEIVTSEFILEEKPDVVVQIIDAQNLERNLFVTIQLIELGVPLVLAVNMVDLAEKQGIGTDFKQLSKLLNAPVVIINARSKKGIDDLMEVIVKQSKTPRRSQIKLKYGTEVDDELRKINNFFIKNDKSIDKGTLEWIAIKLLEGDLRIEQEMIKKPYYNSLKILVDNSVVHLKNIFGKSVNVIFSRVRYGFIKGLGSEVVVSSSNEAGTIADRVDSILMNRFLGVPIFFVVAWVMFQITFSFSEPLMGWLETFFGFLGDKVTIWLTWFGSSDWFISLIVDGVIGGVGGVFVFIPIIGILFLIMAILEDSGYMARVAYVMDKLMHRIGLHGKAFIPLILGFGCNVPGIMATRTLETKRDRLLTILINPFMSCGARLPVYVLFAGAFFSAYQGLVVFSLYFLGVFIAIVVGLVLRKFFFKKLSSPFVIELPPYRWPTAKGLFIHVWEKIWIFIKKAGTIILTFSVIIWFLASFPVGVEYGSQESLAGNIGQTVAPVFEPLGFGNWQSSVALMFGFVAKEVVVGTFGTLYGVDDVESVSGSTSLTSSLQNDFTPLSAYAFMAFVLLYIPCMAVLAVVKRETNSWKWPLIMVVYTTVIAWVVSFIIYQGGLLVGFR